MYEKMFSALETGENSSRPEEKFNSTQMSFGKEIEQIQKQFQDEMQARINELESLVKTKDQKINNDKKSTENKMQEFIMK